MRNTAKQKFTFLLTNDHSIVSLPIVIPVSALGLRFNPILSHYIHTPQFCSPSTNSPSKSPKYKYNIFKMEYYFFYGSLMHRPKLAKILEKPGWHELHSGGSPKDVIHGMAFEVRTSKERDSLIAYGTAYETGAYDLQDCVIDLDGRGRVNGKTFVWNGEFSSLRAGTFDLKDWKLNQEGS
jgi:hypothetical protein